MNHAPHGAGKSSIDLVDLEALLDRLVTSTEMSLLDLGCGVGNYSLAAAERLGPGARVIALDLWQEGVETLSRRAEERGIGFIETARADAAGPLPLADGSMDAVLMATMFHDLPADKRPRALAEIARVLRPWGGLCVVEFKVRDGPPGPPGHVRIGPEELAAAITPAGFEEAERLDLGEHTYLGVFRRL
jgi:ubiquinone/menaquinone biosynthesis C-methylase UbiE